MRESMAMNEEDKAIEGVDVEISVVLGKAIMPIHQLLKMGRGAVIELDANADDDAVVLANDKPIAYGGIIIVDDNIGISITDSVKKNLPEF
ncbi:FliM/FliN family flagellar motor switch protein [uncultured Sneathiella sp.]|jgi:flagellar motor switch protein FliN|nr:FliM/FliN family flagellar motor switch protein [uncultured Sneathiella sp.]